MSNVFPGYEGSPNRARGWFHCVPVWLSSSRITDLLQLYTGGCDILASLLIVFSRRRYFSLFFPLNLDRITRIVIYSQVMIVQSLRASEELMD
jgi:hypothetical protein